MKPKNKQQSKCQVGRRKEIVKIEAKVNQHKYEYKNLSMNPKVVFENFNELDTSLKSLIKK